MLEGGIESTAEAEVQQPLALVLAPTRELVMQIYHETRKFSYDTMIRPVVVYGGVSVGYQRKELEKGCHIVIATPGRLLDFIRQKKVTCLAMLVLSRLFQYRLSYKKCFSVTLDLD